MQRKEQITLSGEELTIEGNFFLSLTNFFVFNDKKSLKMFANKRGVRLPRLVLVRKG